MDHEGIARLAALAKLEISDAEREQFAGQLTDILRYVDQLQAVDTSPQSEDGPQSWVREDVPTPGLDREAALANAPDADREAGLFRVPKVIG
ncbi:MAG: Asp-tRNA(Asn)/Glu-tRNA(Gln) amidotransferase subunit GatC [Acidimicrobiia bacterium]|nr:Asp-tRNA(Asn)/Glu-tRNA(Gln) amidotransferase subunit GatC [Acidimicrobiia bacterium]